MKYCSKCGASLADSAASFCSECGCPIAVLSGLSAQEPPEKQDGSIVPEVARLAPAPKAQEKTATETKNSNRGLDKTVRTRRKPKPAWRSKGKKDSKKPVPPPAPEQCPDPQDENYDGYYEDIVPIDNGNRKIEKMDPETIKKAAWIAGGALVIIIAAIIVLLFM